MRLPRELVGWDALEDAARRAGFVFEFLQHCLTHGHGLPSCANDRSPDSIPEPFRVSGVRRSMLAVRRLTKHYGALVAIHDVSFEARPGEVLGLLGPNGSGKSTTVKILTGLLRQTTGTVQLDGADAFADLENYKAILGYVPEEPHLYSYPTVPEYLRLLAHLPALPHPCLH